LCSPLAKDDPGLATTLLGLLLFGRGFGNILATPISTSLTNVGAPIGAEKHASTGFAVDGGRYARLIGFAGACYAVSALIALVWYGFQRKGYRLSR
jgi:MFS transporter, MCT family, solute carrier family 16 (monocarboxylic acid transporters), member 10